MTLTEIINALLGAVKRRKAELKNQADIIRSKKVADNILEKLRSLNELEKVLTEALPDDDEAPQEAEPAWKPTPEQMEALMLTIEGKAPAPTSYLSRRLEDLYEGLANTYGVECDLHNEDKPEVVGSLRDETGRKKKISHRTLFRILLAFVKYNIIAAICAFCSVLLYENLTWEFTYPLALFSALAVDFLFHKYDQEEE